MRKERQLELNFDDPVEYLSRPTYLGDATRAVPSKATGATILQVEIRVIVEHVIANPNTGRLGK